MIIFGFPNYVMKELWNGMAQLCLMQFRFSWIVVYTWRFVTVAILKTSTISFSVKCDNEIGEENNMMLERKTRVQYKKEDCEGWLSKQIEQL